MRPLLHRTPIVALGQTCCCCHAIINDKRCSMLPRPPSLPLFSGSITMSACKEFRRKRRKCFTDPENTDCSGCCSLRNQCIFSGVDKHKSSVGNRSIRIRSYQRGSALFRVVTPKMTEKDWSMASRLPSGSIEKIVPITYPMPHPLLANGSGRAASDTATITRRSCECASEKSRLS